MVADAHAPQHGHLCTQQLVAHPRIAETIDCHLGQRVGVAADQHLLVGRHREILGHKVCVACEHRNGKWRHAICIGDVHGKNVGVPCVSPTMRVRIRALFMRQKFAMHGWQSREQLFRHGREVEQCTKMERRGARWRTSILIRHAQRLCTLPPSSRAEARKLNAHLVREVRHVERVVLLLCGPRRGGLLALLMLLLMLLSGGGRRRSSNALLDLNRCRGSANVADHLHGSWQAQRLRKLGVRKYIAQQFDEWTPHLLHDSDAAIRTMLWLDLPQLLFRGSSGSSSRRWRK